LILRVDASDDFGFIHFLFAFHSIPPDYRIFLFLSRFSLRFLKVLLLAFPCKKRKENSFDPISFFD